MKALVAGIYGAYYLALPEGAQAKPLLAKVRGKIRIDGPGSQFKLRNRHPLAIGDHIKIRREESHDSEIEAVILEVEKRRNSFQRAGFSSLQILGANIDALFFIASLTSPPMNMGLLSRLLVEAELSKIEPVIIVNKIDLAEKLSPQKKRAIEQNLHTLESLSYTIFRESLHQGISPELRRFIGPGRYLAFGESGVGKSTFLNSYARGNLQAVSEVGVSEKGKHTTTNPTLFRFETGEGGPVEIIDVPGVREFGLSHREAREIGEGYRDFRPLECKFRNCLHLQEPQCGVVEAVTKGVVSSERYRSYLQIMASLDQKYKPRRGNLDLSSQHSEPDKTK